MQHCHTQSPYFWAFLVIKTSEKDLPGCTVFADQAKQIPGTLRRYLYPQKQRKICLHPHEKQ